MVDCCFPGFPWVSSSGSFYHYCVCNCSKGYKLNSSICVFILCVVQVSVSQPVQCLHSGCQLLAADKALLMKLRKSTGYTFIKCKEALERFENDIAQVCCLFCWGGGSNIDWWKNNV